MNRIMVNNKELQMFLKRTLDIFVSSLGLILLLPLFIVISILVKSSSPGPLFFKQERVGKGGQLFNIYKFRTMSVDEDATNNFDFSKDSKRISPVGNFLRRTKFDETIQLYNVLKGEMSLVGPRPTIMNQVIKYDDFQKRRLRVRPGMTGLAQVNGNTALTWEERIIYDVKYVDSYTFLLDIKILIKTILVVLFGEDNFKKVPTK